MIKEAYVSYKIAQLLKEKGFDVKPYYQYYISSCGKVFGCKGEQMKTQISNRGYERIWLTINGKREHHSVHRLVALNFVPNPEKKLEVNHIDGNKLNNNASNLEWCTRRENAVHSIRVLGNPKPPKPTVSPNRHLTFEQAQAIRADSRTQREIASEYGITQGSVSLIKRGITYTKEDQ